MANRDAPRINTNKRSKKHDLVLVQTRVPRWVRDRLIAEQKRCGHVSQAATYRRILMDWVEQQKDGKNADSKD